MAQTPVSGNHSFQNYNPWARYKAPATVSWGSTANTCTITDPKCSPNSFLCVNVVGTTPAAGRWSVQSLAGSIVITSSDPENSALTLEYILL
jgi:hypothetical protein